MANEKNSKRESFIQVFVERYCPVISAFSTTVSDYPNSMAIFVSNSIDKSI